MMRRLFWVLLVLCVAGAARAIDYYPAALVPSSSPETKNRYTDSKTIGLESYGADGNVFIKGDGAERTDFYPVWYDKDGVPHNVIGNGFGIKVNSGSVFVKVWGPSFPDTSDACGFWLSLPDSVGRDNTLALPFKFTRVSVRTKDTVSPSANASVAWWAY